MICVNRIRKNKNRKNNNKNNNNNNIKRDSSYNTEYSYDFIPSLHLWTNIDDQQKIVKRLENIEKNIDKKY